MRVEAADRREARRPRSAEPGAECRTASRQPGARPVQSSPAAQGPAKGKHREVQSTSEQITFLARADEQHLRRRDTAHLVGMAIVSWGLLFTFGGLLLAGRSGNSYYLLGGLVCLPVGSGLLLARRWAIWLQLATSAGLLTWAAAQNPLSLAWLQASPFWLPALWLFMPSIRDVLD